MQLIPGCLLLVTSENAACVCEMPFISSFFSSSLLSSLWWKCDRIFRLHPVAQLPAPLSTQQRLRLAHFRPLGLRHFLGFHQVKELLSSLSYLSKQKMDRMKNVRVSLQAHLSICNETKQPNKQTNISAELKKTGFFRLDGYGVKIIIIIISVCLRPTCDRIVTSEWLCSCSCLCNGIGLSLRWNRLLRRLIERSWPCVRGRGPEFEPRCAGR